MLECSKLVVKSMQDDKTTEEKLSEWPFPSVNHIVLSQMASSRFLYLRLETACKDAKSQSGSPAEPEIFSQIVICLLSHADICDILSFKYVDPVAKRIQSF